MFRFFEGLIDPFPEPAELKPPKTLLAFCRYYARGTGVFLLLMALLSGIIAILEVSLFAFLGKLVDLLAAHTPKTLLQESGDTLAIMAIVILVVLPALVGLKSMLIHQTLLGNFPMRIRWLSHRYLLGQSLQFYQDEFAGRLATKVMQTSLAVREAVMKLLDVLVYVAVYFSGIVILMASLNPVLALPFILWFGIYVLVLRYFLPRLAAVSARQADARSEMTGRIVDTYTNISTVKLFSHSHRESDYAREAMGLFLSTVHPQMRLATSLNVSVWISNCVLTFSVAALSIWLWLQGDIGAGAITAAVGLVLRLFGMSQWIMWEVSALFENIGTARDGMNTFSQPCLVQDRPDAKTLDINETEGIKFQDVNFDYGNGERVIEHLNLHIRPGEKVGLIGRSGAGKSTLVNLLLRFYDLESGAITIDGQNIVNVSQRSLRENIGMVTQDTSLLHRSLRDNLLYGRPDASDAELKQAAQQAQADEFIEHLYDAKQRRGYDAHVGERGVKLSGGQRQRIAIARVLLKNAPILILDEATSALDSEVEMAIQENLKTLMEGKTVIAIAHRLSTIAALDRLIVIDKGQIIEEGSHAQLIAKKGIYAQLWAHQSGGFLGDN